MKSIKLILCLLLCVGGGWLTGLLTESSVANWYPKLNRAPWTPPNAAFPIAWTILYTLMAIALWLVWIRPAKDKALAYFSFYLQLFLNFIWSWLFFYLQNPTLGLIDITLLWIAIIFNIICFWKHSSVASCLLLPYLLWVSYAFSLNFFIWMHN